MKFLALCVGIESANSKFACVWCKCPADEQYNMKETWSFKDISKGACTIEEIQKFSALRKRKNLAVLESQFPRVPVDHIIPDILLIPEN